MTKRISMEQVTQHMQEKPVETGALLVGFGLLLKTTFIVKAIAYGFITFGLIFLWKGLKPRLEESND